MGFEIVYHRHPSQLSADLLESIKHNIPDRLVRGQAANRLSQEIMTNAAIVRRIHQEMGDQGVDRGRFNPAHARQLRHTERQVALLVKHSNRGGGES
jgi:hypothetical protein